MILIELFVYLSEFLIGNGEGEGDTLHLSFDILLLTGKLY